MIKTTLQPQEIEITQEVVTALLIRLFKALRKAFTDGQNDGAIRAFELIEMLTEIAENDPDVFKSVLTEENIAAFTKLQKKAQTGSVGINDLLKAFPAIGGAMKGGMLSGMFK